MDAPDTEEIIIGVSKSLHYTLTIHLELLMENTLPTYSGSIRIFDERLYPLTRHRNSFDYFRIPTIEEILVFVKYLFLKQNLSPQVGIMAVHYVDQFILKTGIALSAANWRRILLSAILVADKVWEEDVVCNADYCGEAFPFLTVEDLNLLEREFLLALEFKLLIMTISVYAEYYFALRSIAGLEYFPSIPLDKESARQLENKQVENSVPDNLKRRRRSRSMINNPDLRKKCEEKDSVSLEQLSQRSNNYNFRQIR